MANVMLGPGFLAPRCGTETGHLHQLAGHGDQDGGGHSEWHRSLQGGPARIRPQGSHPLKPGINEQAGNASSAISEPDAYPRGDYDVTTFRNQPSRSIHDDSSGPGDYPALQAQASWRLLKASTKARTSDLQHQEREQRIGQPSAPKFSPFTRALTRLRFTLLEVGSILRCRRHLGSGVGGRKRS